MARDSEEVADVAASFHAEVPTTYKSSLTMSKYTRDLLTEIRESINDDLGSPIVDTNDVIRLALLGAHRYERALADPAVDVDPAAEPLRPLLEELAAAVRADDALTAKERETR